MERSGELYERLEALLKSGGPVVDATIKALRAQIDAAEASVREVNTLYELLDVSRPLLALGPDTEPRGLYYQVAQSARKITRADIALIVPYDAVNERLRVVEAAGDGLPADFQLREPRLGGVSRHILEEGELVVENIEEAAGKPEYSFLRGADFYKVLQVQAFIGMRVGTKEEPLGVMFIDYREPHFFTEFERGIVQTFARQVAVAIQNVQLMKKLRLLDEIGRTLIEQQELESVLRLVLDRLVDFVEYHTAGVLLDRGAFLEVIAASGEEKAVLSRFVLPAGASPFVEKMRQRRTPVHISDITQEQHWYKVPGMEKGRSWLGVPLFVGDRYFGELSIYHSDPGFYTEKHYPDVVLFAQRASFAIYSAESRKGLEHRIQVFGALNQAVQSLLSVGRLEQVLKEIVRQVRELFEADVVTLYQYKGMPGEDIRANRFRTPPIWLGELNFPQYMETEIREGDLVVDLLQELLSQRRPLFLKSLEEVRDEGRERFFGRSRFAEGRFAKREGIQSVAILPLVVWGGQPNPIGILFINYRKERAFSDEEQEEMKLFAAQAALAIQNARRLEEAYAYLAELGQLSIELARTPADLDETLRTIADRCRVALEADVVDVFLFDGARLVRRGKKEEEVDVILDIRKSVCGRVYQTGQPVLIADVDVPGWWSEVYQESVLGRMRSELAVPLRDRGKVIGVLNLERREPNAFDEHHQNLAASLAGFIAATVRSANLSAELKTLQELQEEVRRGEGKLEDVLRRILEGAQNLVNFEAGWLLLVERDGLYIWAATDKRDLGRRLEFEDSVTGRAALRNEVIYIPNLDEADEELRRLYKAPEAGRMKSELVVPIADGDKVIGVFNIESRRAEAFSEHDKEVLQALAGQAAFVIRNFRLARETAELQKIQAKIVTGKFDRQEVFNTILQACLDLVGSDLGQLLLREGDYLVVHATTGKEPVGEFRVHVDDCVTGRVVKTGQPINLPDVSQDPLYKPVLGGGMRSELAVPLLDEQGRAFGVLNVESRRLKAFSRSDQELLQRLAGWAATAVRSARLYEELKTLREIDTQLLTQVFDLKRVLDLILRSALRLIGARFAQVLLVEGENLVIQSTTGKERIGTRVPVRECVSGLAVIRKEPVLADLREPKYASLYKAYLGKEAGIEMKTELVVPMEAEDQVIGVINIESDEINAFDEHDKELLQVFAGQAALAIQRARQLEQQRIEAMGLLAADLVHRMNTPLSAIRARVQLLKRLLPQIPQAQQQRLQKGLEEISRDIDATLEKVDNIRQIAGNIGPTDVQQHLERALREVSIPESIRLEQRIAPNLPRVKANDQLYSLIRNLINNAVEAIKRAEMEEGTITLEVRRDQFPDGIRGECVTIVVKDTGPGIPAEIRPYIFDPFFTLKSGEQKSGLGLWWTKRYAEDFCGGEIEVDDNLETGHGAVFTIRLPLLQPR